MNPPPPPPSAPSVAPAPGRGCRNAMLAALFPQKYPPKVVFVTGDDEYRSEYTMPASPECRARISCSCFRRVARGRTR